jgi:hypothetical protein
MAEILSDDEHADLVRGAGLVCTAGWPINDLIRYGRAVERAVVEKLAAMGGELPSSTKHVTSWDGDSCDWVPIYAYTAYQLRTERAKGVAAGMAAERDALAALLTEARGAVAYANYHGASGAPDALLARIDAALAAKEQSK